MAMTSELPSIVADARAHYSDAATVNQVEAKHEREASPRNIGPLSDGSDPSDSQNQWVASNHLEALVRNYGGNLPLENARLFFASDPLPSPVTTDRDRYAQIGLPYPVGREMGYATIVVDRAVYMRAEAMELSSSDPERSQFYTNVAEQYESMGEKPPAPRPFSDDIYDIKLARAAYAEIRDVVETMPLAERAMTNRALEISEFVLARIVAGESGYFQFAEDVHFLGLKGTDLSTDHITDLTGRFLVSLGKHFSTTDPERAAYLFDVFERFYLDQDSDAFVDIEVDGAVYELSCFLRIDLRSACLHTELGGVVVVPGSAEVRLFDWVIQQSPEPGEFPFTIYVRHCDEFEDEDVGEALLISHDRAFKAGFSK